MSEPPQFQNAVERIHELKAERDAALERAEALREALELIVAHPWSDRHSAGVFKAWARFALHTDDAKRGAA
jgi:hypothetical protein